MLVVPLEDRCLGVLYCTGLIVVLTLLSDNTCRQASEKQQAVGKIHIYIYIYNYIIHIYIYI